jgi:hypothetical protein
LQGNAVETLINHERLTNLVEDALRYIGDSNLYLAWNQATFPNLYQNQTMLESWFSTLIRSGVADVIEIPRATRKETIVKTLHERAQQSQQRQPRLHNLVSSEGWEIVLRRGPFGKLSFENFIDRFLVDEELYFEPCSNLAVFYDRAPKGPDQWSDLIRRSQRLKCRANWFIATRSQSNDLHLLWKQEARKFKPKCFDGVFEFNGNFEWVYALLRLHLATQLARCASTKVGGKAMF